MIKKLKNRNHNQFIRRLSHIALPGVEITWLFTLTVYSGCPHMHDFQAPFPLISLVIMYLSFVFVVSMYSHLVLITNWLCREVMGKILATGHSRIPIYSGSPKNIIGLLLVCVILVCY
jgi:hypothetical protein